VEFGGAVPSLPPTKPSWCTCGVCRPMPTEEENKCCGKIRCVTSFLTFQNTCTNRAVLVMPIRGRCDIRAEEPKYSTNSFRKAAYRQYILWRYKKLGRGNRRVCPSCVVLAIRQLYSAQDGIYMGFKTAWAISCIVTSLTKYFGMRYKVVNPSKDRFYWSTF
jgi:P2X purinoceptor 7